MDENKPHLFRDKDGKVKDMLSYVEGISFRESPLDFFILLARYKFAVRFLKRTDTVLDAGCGHGVGTVLLSRFAKRVVGADVDRAMIERNQKEYRDIANASFTTIDLVRPDPALGQFDAVVSLDVIEHFEKDQTRTVAANYAGLVRENGFALIGTPNIASQPYASKRRLETHLHEFTPEEFEAVLTPNFRRVFLFSMTDEVVSTSFPKMAWYLMALCVK